VPAAKYTVDKFDHGMHFILPDRKAIAPLLKNGHKRVICRLNDQLEFHAALMPKKEGGHFIIIGMPICRKLKLKAGSTVTASFKADNTDYQFDMPAELKEVLDTDPEAHRIFHALTAGNQRGLMHIVSLVKSADKRVERALNIAEKIKHGITAPRLMLKK
jgi:Bacteriocin-protection, YdeI or OmpD-Associated/Domain of unknown function (DUF1905)